MRRYGETISQIGPYHYEGPVCPCRNYLCRPADDPYCPRSELFVGRGAALPASVEGRELSLVEQFDAMAAHHRAEAKRRVEGERTTGVSAEVSPPVVPPKPVRRPSKKERKRRELDRKARATEPAWLLDESDPILDAAMKAEEA